MKRAYEPTEEDIKIIKDIREKDLREESSEVMAELLADDNWSTWKMFESLCSDYLNGSDEVKEGINLALTAITGWTLQTIAQKVLSRAEESEEE